MSAPTKPELNQPRAGSPIKFVRANALAPFVLLLDSIGAPVERLLRQARVPPSALGDSELLLPAMSAYRFAELAALHEQIEDLGVVVGQRASAFDLGDYGAVLQEASTIYEYLNIGVQLIGDHSSGTRFWLTTEGDMLRVNQHLAGPPSAGRCIADIYTLVITISMLRRMVAPTWSPGEVRLLAGDESLLGNRDVFGDAPLITGQRHSSFTIARLLLQLPVPSGRAGTTPHNARRNATGQPMPTDFKTSAEQVIMSQLSDGYPGIQAVAEAASMSPRTLQRRLAESGTTFSRLVATSRLRMAKTWLTESDMPIAQIASTLGYTEASNFARAFRRQTGVSPATYRRNQARD